MGLAKPFAYKIGGIFHPSTNTAEPAMYAHTPTGSWVELTDGTAWWSAYSGSRFYPHFHPGVDLFAPIGTPILAMEAGIVTKAGWSSTASGYAVNVDIKPGTRYVHGHCSKVLVRVGQHVARGQLVALVGHSGIAKGDHAHTGLQIGSRLVNPLLYMEGGIHANDAAIKPLGTVAHARVKGPGINIRTSADLDVGTQNIYATSRTDGIYRGTLRIGALTYAFVYLGSVTTDDGIWAKLTGFGRTLYVRKDLLVIY